MIPNKHKTIKKSALRLFQINKLKIKIESISDFYKANHSQSNFEILIEIIKTHNYINSNKTNFNII